MPSVSKSVEVPLSQDEAFALITDTSRFPEWLTMHESWPGGEPGELAHEAEFSGAAIQGPMGDMVTKRAGEELEASLGKLKELAG